MGIFSSDEEPSWLDIYNMERKIDRVTQKLTICLEYILKLAEKDEEAQKILEKVKEI